MHEVGRWHGQGGVRVGGGRPWGRGGENVVTSVVMATETHLCLMAFQTFVPSRCASQLSQLIKLYIQLCTLAICMNTAYQLAWTAFTKTSISPLQKK